MVQQGDRARAGVIEGRSIDTTFRMDKGAVVDLQATFGTIVVTGSSGNEIRVRASTTQGRVRLRASSTLATLRASSEQGGMGEVRYEVMVPAGVRVVMQTTSGDLTATGVRGDVEAQTISGNVRLENISGMAQVEAVSGHVVASQLLGGVEIEATSGEVTITGAEGEVDVENTSGSITLTDIRSSVVHAETISGDVRFDGTISASGRYEFSSHSGNVRLTVPANAGAMLALSTYTGTINSEFPITVQGWFANRDKQLQFRLGSGSARLSAESFSGNIFITRGTARDRQE
jgi:DUF4097 and DUF4098 domain-containing protein YvlB